MPGKAVLPDDHNTVEISDSFRSADSVPDEFALERPWWLTPLFLLGFAVGSAVIIYGINPISIGYKAALSFLARVDPSTVAVGSIGFRPFFALLTVFLVMFGTGSLMDRIRRSAVLVVLFIAGSLATDILYLRFQSFGGPSPFSTFGSVTSGFVCMLLIGVNVFDFYHLPEDSVVKREVKRSYTPLFLILGVSLVLAIGLMYLAFGVGTEHVNALRNHGVLGGLGPGIPLFLPSMMIGLYVWGRVGVAIERRKRLRNWLPRDSFPTVAFLVPAYNEAEQIGACIRALDKAALEYPGLVWLYLVDNASEDDTNAIAEAEIAQCGKLKPPFGKVLYCPTPGKAVALNYGLSRIQQAIVVRVDADTTVTKDVLNQTIPYFDDPQIGGVAGFPLPKPWYSPLGLMRTIEVYNNIGFNRTAQTGIDAVMVLPGIMSAFLREPLVQLGGFAEGINGEDTDITIRFGRLGYRLVSDTAIRVYSEVPPTFAALREQRLRWSRSLYHVVARNLSAIKMMQGPRGAWVLVWALYYSSRRLWVLPIFIYALALWAAEPANPVLRQGAAVVAVVVGQQVFTLALVLLSYRKLHYLPLIPAFLVFRMMRVYFALESYFTLPHVPAPETASEPELRPAPAPAFALVEDGSSIFAAAAEIQRRASQSSVGDGFDRTNDGVGNVPRSSPTLVDLERIIPQHHTLRSIRPLVEQATERLAPSLSSAMASVSATPMKLVSVVKASLLMVLYDCEDEGHFCKELVENEVYRWFMRLDAGDDSIDPAVLRQHRARLLEFHLGRKLVDGLVRETERRSSPLHALGVGGAVPQQTQ